MYWIKCVRTSVMNKHGVELFNNPVNLDKCYHIYPRHEKGLFYIDFEIQCVAKAVHWTFLDEDERDQIYSEITENFRIIMS